MAILELKGVSTLTQHTVQCPECQEINNFFISVTADEDSIIEAVFYCNVCEWQDVRRSTNDEG